MAKLKGLDKLNQAIKFVKEVAEQAQKELDAKREKNDGNSDKWQESEKAEEWRNHLQEVEDMIARIDDLDEIEFE
jgi:cbb3-type cytochrome oxidase cytochrome c subunit